jgi:hypothetical protein
MPLGQVGKLPKTQVDEIELDRLSPEGTKLPAETGKTAKDNPLGLAASESDRPALDPKGQQNGSLQQTSFAKVALKSGDGAGHIAEKALLQVKGISDHTAFKHLDNLFTGNKAGFTQIGSLGKVISGAKPLTKEQTIALSEEAVAGVGLASSKAWSVGRTITFGISSAASKDALKDSVSSVPIDKVAFNGVNGINTAFAGIAVIKSSVELARDVTLDVLAHSERRDAQALLKQYDPKTGQFSDPVTGQPVDAEENSKLTAQLKELISKKGGDRSRSAGQIAGDRLSTVRDIAVSGANVTNAALSLANVAAKATPGLSQALSAVGAAQSTWKATTNIVALNNIQHAAKQAKGDHLLEAIAAHVQQERVYNSRKNLVSAAVNFTSVGLGVAALAAGPGAPAALAIASIASTAVTSAVGLGTTAFELGHAYQLSQRRKEGSAEALALFKEAVGNDALSQANKDEAFKALANPKNIGLAERALIDRLQNGTPEEVKTAVEFLENFGLSQGTISKLKLASPDKALTALQSALYSDKVKLTLAGAKQSFYSLGKVTGISQFASFVKGKWDQYQAKKANFGFAPYQSLIVKASDKGTKNLIRGLDEQIANRVGSKVSDAFERARDKYLKVPQHKFVYVNREPVKFGADIEFDEESAWNPKTGQYDDF